MLELLEGWLRHKSDMVNYEAARAICEIRNVTSTQLVRPIAGKAVLSSTRFLLFVNAYLFSHHQSPATLPVILQVDPQICRHPYIECSCSYSCWPGLYLQCGYRESHYGF